MGRKSSGCCGPLRRLQPLPLPLPFAAVEDLDRLPAQLGVEQGEVLVGELAGGVVELGVADLAVLGFLERLELGVGDGPPRRRPRAGQSAIRAPVRAIRPPIQIQVTSGSTMTRKVAGASSAR